MNHRLNPAQQEIREAILKICARFGDDYWLARDSDGGFPHEFHKALAEAGWLGIAMPEAYGGSGLGITEAADHDAGDRRVRRGHVRRLRACT